MLHLVFLSQFGEVVVLDVQKELSVGDIRAVPMVNYFSETTVQEGMSYFRRFRRFAFLLNQFLPLAGIVLFLGLMAISVVIIVRRRGARQRR